MLGEHNPAGSSGTRSVGVSCQDEGGRDCLWVSAIVVPRQEMLVSTQLGQGPWPLRRPLAGLQPQVKHQGPSSRPPSLTPEVQEVQLRLKVMPAKCGA